MRKLRHLALALTMIAGALVVSSSASQAANPGTPGDIAFIRGGNIFVKFPTIALPRQITTANGYSWPRWMPDGFGNLAYVHNNQLFVVFVSPQAVGVPTLIATGSAIGAPSWSPDGSRIAFLEGTAVSGTLFIARFNASDNAAHPGALIGKPVAVHTFSARSAGATTAKPAKTPVFSPLRFATGVAWSPNGQWIAFPGGECLGIFDSCMSVTDVATNAEWVIQAFGGGGDDRTGFATVPAWSADSSRLLWTQQATDPAHNDALGPLQIWSSGPHGESPAQVGQNGDSEPAPSPAGGTTLLVTGSVPGQSASWIIQVKNHQRLAFFAGFMSDWQAA